MNYMRQKLAGQGELNVPKQKFHLSSKKNQVLSHDRTESGKENNGNTANRDFDIYNYRNVGVSDPETSPPGSQNYILRLEDSVATSSGKILPCYHNMNKSRQMEARNSNTTVSLIDSNNSSSEDNSPRRNNAKIKSTRIRPTPFYSDHPMATILIESSDSDEDPVISIDDKLEGLINLDSDDDSVLKALKIDREDAFDRMKRSSVTPKSFESTESLSGGKSGAFSGKIDIPSCYRARNSSDASSSTHFSPDSNALREGGGLSGPKVISESSSNDEGVSSKTNKSYAESNHSNRSKLNSSGGSKRKSLSSNESYGTKGDKFGNVTCRSNAKFQTSIRPYDSVKLTKKDAEMIFKGVKTGGNSHWTPKLGPPCSKQDSESLSSYSQAPMNGEIISETPSELVMSESGSEDEVINSSSPDLKPGKTHLSRFVNPSNQEQLYSSLSDRKKNDISRWIMENTPGSSNSSGIISDSNRNSSFGNSSLERFELKHETPNNRGRISKPTSEKSNSVPKGLDRFIYKGKSSVLKNQTPAGTRGLPEITKPFDDSTPNNKTDKPKPRQIGPTVKTVENLNIVDCADLLDTLYGNAWRNKANAVLTPQTEPRIHRNVANKELSKTERKHTSKPVAGNRLIISSSEEDELDSFANDIRPNFNSTKKKAPRDSFINDKSTSENSSESFYQTALTNPIEWKGNPSWVPKTVPVSLSTKKAIAVCDSDSDADENFLPVLSNDLNQRRLSFSEDLSDSSTSEFDPGEVVPPKPKAKKAPAKTCRQIPKPTLSQGSSGHDLSKNKTKSFLTSLSATVPIQNCHPEARVFRDNYKNKKEELCKYLFKLYNKKIFDGKLPNDMAIEWNVRMRGTAGFCYNKKTVKSLGGVTRSSRIVLATKILDTPDRLRDTLVHEMCHAAAWLINNVSDGHGPFWKGWASKAVKVFPELPPIKRCHDYQIKTKFTYRCTKCGYSVGRHSKSLDIERKRCGHCYGKFELLVNRTTRSGTTQVATPVQTRLPTGFALFVKENYHSVKKDRQSIKHAQVMKILGQQFSAIKIGKKTVNDVRT